MFSIGELLLTAAVAAIVLGPKRLPEVAYQCGVFMRKLKGWVQPLSKTLEQSRQHIELQKNRQRAAAAEKQYTANHD